ncbi:MAG: LSU ribosomal protein L33p, partial [uncultured Acidimicrobiales bacterium]
GQGREAGEGDAGVRGVQAPELHHHEEQAERPGTHGDQEVLPVGPDAHEPPGDSL